MNKKIARFFVMGKAGEGVTDSQVYGWMKLLNEGGISTSIISFVDEINYDLDLKSINEKTGGKFYQIIKKPALIRDIYYFFLLKSLYLESQKNADTIIFQTRIPTIAYSFILLKLFTKAKIIYDIRGATIEEIKHSNKTKKISLRIALNIKSLLLKEWLLIKFSDHIYTVSNTLKNYYQNHLSKKKSNNKISVMPCAADKMDFYYDERERQLMRKEFQFTNENVLLYSGKLDKAWHIPKEIFKFYIELAKHIDNLALFILTPDFEIAHKLIKQFNLNEELVRVKKDSYQNVRKYLNMVDYGLLLREDVVMNHVSSPTKFAEYQLCGLPVIISDSVHDYAELIKKTGYGLVVNNFKLDSNQTEEIESLTKLERVTISEWSKLHLSKQIYIDKIINTFQEL